MLENPCGVLLGFMEALADRIAIPDYLIMALHGRLGPSMTPTNLLNDYKVIET